MEKDKKTGAVRKIEEGAKAPDSSTDEVPSGATVVDKAPKADEAKAPIIDPKKAKRALTDKVYKDKKKQEKLADEIAEIEAEAKRGHFIEEGKSISCQKGILGPGDRVKPEYFGRDGVAILKRLVESGAIKEVK